MKCPKCGYERQSRDDAFVPPGECPACGLVYAKHDTTREPADEKPQVQAPNLKPSPVDALSLRKARERVEKRLREQQKNRVPDDRHAQTLELAKQFASEELRKRQEKKRQAHDEAERSATADSDGELPAPVAEAADPALADQGSPDLQTRDAVPAADELMTTAEDIMEAAADSTPPAGEDAPADADYAVAAEVFREDPEPGPDEEGETAPPDANGTLPDGQTPSSAASLSAEPEAEIPEFTDDLPAAHVAAATLPRAPKSGPKAGLTRILPIVAWLILAAGVIGALLSWTTINEVEAGARTHVAEGMNGLPLGLLLGFAYLATGVLGFAFFWVSSLISNQLKDIHNLLLAKERDSDAMSDETA